MTILNRTRNTSYYYCTAWNKSRRIRGANNRIETFWSILPTVSPYPLPPDKISYNKIILLCFANEPATESPDALLFRFSFIDCVQFSNFCYLPIRAEMRYHFFPRPALIQYYSRNITPIIIYTYYILYWKYETMNLFFFTHLPIIYTVIGRRDFTNMIIN